MGLVLVEIKVYKVEEPDQIMCDRRTFKSTTMTRINKGLQIGEDPVSNEGLILLAEISSASKIPEVVF